ncbi:hypothetical protein BsWGS_21885 [Bradybaena similaris]
MLRSKPAPYVPDADIVTSPVPDIILLPMMTTTTTHKSPLLLVSSAFSSGKQTLSQLTPHPPIFCYLLQFLPCPPHITDTVSNSLHVMSPIFVCLVDCLCATNQNILILKECNKLKLLVTECLCYKRDG